MATKKIKGTLSIEDTLELPSYTQGRVLTVGAGGAATESTIETSNLEQLSGVTSQVLQLSDKDVAGGVAALDITGKLSTAVLPGLAITSVFTAASEVEMLGLQAGSGAQEGDIAIRTDESKTYVHNGGDGSTLAGWSELLTPTDAVTSVNSQTGAVTLNGSNLNSAVTGNIITVAGTIDQAIGALDTGIGFLNFAPANYSPVDAGIVADHLSAIDTALGSFTSGATELNGLTDVTITSATNGQILRYNGTNWENASESGTVKVSTSDDTAGYISDSFVFSEGTNSNAQPLQGSITGAPNESYQIQFDASKVDVVDLNFTSSSINLFPDVDTGTASENDYLKYVGGQWTPSTIPAGVSSLNDLSDVSVAAATDGQFLQRVAGTWQGVDVTIEDKFVGVSANDSTPGSLEDKIVVSVGTNTTNALEASTLNDGADEDFQIQFDATKISLSDMGSSSITALSDVTAAYTLADNQILLLEETAVPGEYEFKNYLLGASEGLILNVDPGLGNVGFSLDINGMTTALSGDKAANNDLIAVYDNDGIQHAKASVRQIAGRSAGDIAETEHSVQEVTNQLPTVTPVPFVTFDSSVVRSFDMLISFEAATAGGGEAEVFKLTGIQASSGWVMFTESVGDDCGITFDIDPLTGAVDYIFASNTLASGAYTSGSGNFRYRAKVTSTATAYDGP